MNGFGEGELHAAAAGMVLWFPESSFPTCQPVKYFDTNHRSHPAWLMLGVDSGARTVEVRVRHFPVASLDWRAGLESDGFYKVGIARPG